MTDRRPLGIFPLFDRDTKLRTANSIDTQTPDKITFDAFRNEIQSIAENSAVEVEGRTTDAQITIKNIDHADPALVAEILYMAHDADIIWGPLNTAENNTTITFAAQH